MRFSTRVLIALLCAAVLTHGVLFALMYGSARRNLFEEMRSQVTNIAATGALTIDVAGHEKIRGRASADSPDYAALLTTLRAIRDANRRDDMRVKYVYTARPNPANPSGFEFVGDAEESAEDRSLPGDPFPDLPEALRLDEARADEAFAEDQWGTWLSASAPIRDASGRAVAVLGVDVAADRVRDTLNALLWRGTLALGVSFVLACGIAWWIYRWVNQSLEKVERAMDRVKRGDYATMAEFRRGDEFERVAQALNAASRALREREVLRENLARVVGDKVAGRLAQPGGGAEKPGEGGAPVFLFAGFGDATSQLARECEGDAALLIEDLCAAVIDGVVEFGGEVAAFHPDGLLAVFSRGENGTEAAPKRALHAAYRVRQRAEKLFWKWVAEGRISDRPWLGVSVDAPDPAAGGGSAITDRIAAINARTRDLSIGVLASAAIARAVTPEIELRPVDDTPDCQVFGGAAGAR
ncbi:MAG: HAMP domain-containing protein [Verrucomicrobiae bacterium]|nr:HAMP domain-containing protein [Verrucomicrobiae bacterium]